MTLFIRLCSKGNRTIIEEEEINLLIQESSESVGEAAKPKKKKKPMVNESSASESDSEVDKEKENLLEDDHYDIVIEK